jgi:polysaccharide biosynthesis transport protein
MEDIAQAFLKRPGVILLVVLGFVGPTLVFTLLQPTVYEASAKLMVGGGLKLLGVTQDSDLSKNAEGLQELTRLVVEAIDSRPVAEEAIQRLGLRMKPGELLENLSVEQEGSTQFIQLSYKDTDPERAQRIVNTVGVVSSERIPEAMGGPPDVTVRMWEEASVPTNPASPDPVRNVALVLILGLMVGPVLAIWMDQRASRG